MTRRAVARTHENVIAAWEDPQFADPAEGAQGFKLLEYWRIIFKHKWVIVAAVAVALAIGLVITLLTPRVYTAGTTIEIDRETSNVVSQNMDVAPVERLSRDQEFFQTQYGLLKSFSLAQRVAQSPGLASDPAFMKAMGARQPPTAAQLSQGWGAGFLEGGLSVYPVRDSRLVRISFDSPDPGLSARIANAFA
ncbi:MAG TPA: Wzz/FepE/Etk N-terminal domain-containing protein, partial [Caulobacteraceae bacterium]|nr:Wzz/FepE/Etk N-terminal domain-containing protein [Caulobacteraceae bacterium]